MVNYDKIVEYIDYSFLDHSEIYWLSHHNYYEQAIDDVVDCDDSMVDCNNMVVQCNV